MILRWLFLPFIPKVGPWEGCLKVAKAFLFFLTHNACTRPKVVVLLPSPSGVGVILSRKNRRDYFKLLTNYVQSLTPRKQYTFHPFVVSNDLLQIEIPLLFCYHTLILH